jgi:glycosyltransferase involved in cell wall biosynthesis
MILSVIIPIHNAGENFSRCLNALFAGSRHPDELIVVDDASTDASIQYADHFHAEVLSSQSTSPVGPAKSRNRGAAVAIGDILVFIDADVRVHHDTLEIIERKFIEQPELAALFGSYDDSPPHKDLVSLYKNLQHHFVHQKGKQDASTFWSGIGAIRRHVFIESGGFDEAYSQPSIEDIELGVRLKRAGHRISLFPNIQVTHLKQWNLLSLLKTDIFHRAIPWTKLILNTSQMPSDLNLDRKSRLSAFLVWAFLFLLVLGIWFRSTWAAALLCLGLVIFINFPLYRFFYQRKGLLFTLGAVALHLFYFMYSSLTFATLWVEHIFSNLDR